MYRRFYNPFEATTSGELEACPIPPNSIPIPEPYNLNPNSQLKSQDLLLQQEDNVRGLTFLVWGSLKGFEQGFPRGSK